MKKNFTAKDKIWKVMKICSFQAVLAMTLCCLALAHKNHGQVLDKKVTISLTDVSIEEALEAIEKVTGVRFFYSVDQLGIEEKITLEVVERSLRRVLDDLLLPYDVGYKVHEKKGTITLKRKSGDDTGILLEMKRPASSPNQAGTVRGTVTNGATQQPMAGVNVIVKGTSTGTTTDAKGNFVIHATSHDILVFSFIGFKTVEMQVGTRTVIDLRMEEDVEALDKVTIYATGYREVSPERTTGSFSHLGSELIDRNVGPDVLSRLNGLVPSLLIDQRNGTDSFLSIRGRSTIMANDQPLIVVDNFPYNGDISTINPNDIESITVLRDAAAASIWGVRAGNGVIVITTKRGDKGTPLRIDVNTNVTITDELDLFYERRMSTADFIDTEEMLFGHGYFDAMINDPRSPAVSPVIEILLQAREGVITPAEAEHQLNLLRDRDVRHELARHFYQPAMSQQYALSVSGGSHKHSYYFSAGYDGSRGNEVGDAQKRLSLNFQNTFNLSDKLQLDMRLVHTRSDADIANTVSTLKMGGRALYPYAQLTDEGGRGLPIVYDYRKAFIENAQALGFLNWEFNPIEELGWIDNTVKQLNTRLSAGARYSIGSSLSAEFRYQYEAQARRGRDLRPVESYFTRNLINQFSEFDGSQVESRPVPEGGILTFSDHEIESQNGRLNLTFSNSWDKHDVSALAGFEIREVKGRGHANRFYGYDPVLGSSAPVNYADYYRMVPTGVFSTIPDFSGVSGTIDRYRSYFANAAYTYAGRYTASLGGRIDQSNLFGVKANQRSSPLWSVGGKWVINRESFYASDALPLLSLRATYGFTGNLDQNVTALTTARFVTAAYSRRDAARLTNPPNPQLRWEKSRMINLAIDFSMKDEVISGKIEFYKRRGIDLIGEGPMDPTKGMDSFKGNIASMSGSGWDVELNSVNLNKKVRWESRLFFSYTTDKVTKYDLEPNSVASYFVDGSLNRFSSNYTPVEGRPLFGIYSFQAAGLDPDTGDPRGYLNGEPSAQWSEIMSAATIDSLLYHGPALPPAFGSLRNTFSLKDWSLSFNVTYRFGYYFRRNSISYGSLFSTYDGHEDFSKRWQKAGDELFTDVPSMIYPANSARDAFYSRSNTLIERADNIRLQDLRIGYRVRNLSLGRLTIADLDIYGYVNNVGLLWAANNHGLDPDFQGLPLPRSYAVGLRLGI